METNRWYLGSVLSFQFNQLVPPRKTHIAYWPKVETKSRFNTQRQNRNEQQDFADVPKLKRVSS